jgi:serine/threonine-protein kinase
MLSPGVQLGKRYRLDERIASGGMGDVWRGTDQVLGRTVAVKSLLRRCWTSRFAERFRGEARPWRPSTTPAWSTSTTSAAISRSPSW